MRKKSKQISAMIVAVALAMSSMSGTVSAKTLQQANKVQSTTPKKAKNVKKNVPKAEYKKGEAVVMYYGTTAKKSIASTDNRFGGNIKVEETYDFTTPDAKYKAKSNSKENRLLVSKVSSESYSTEELVSKLKGQSNVEYAEPNYIYKTSDVKGTKAAVHNNSEYAPYQWALKNVGQNGGTEGCDIGVQNAWDRKGGTNKVIAVVDTGVDYTNPDLAENMWKNPYQNKLKGEYGYDFKNHDDDPMDDVGHGSHCAGIIAGSGKQVSGVNQTAQIMALKWLDDWGGEDADVIAAYDYINRAIDMGVDVVAINNSWGGMGRTKILEDLIEIVGKKGAITVAAAGNNMAHLNNPQYEDYCWNFNSDYKIEVAATNEKDEMAGFSNYGSAYVDLGAPGVDILSTVVEDTYNPSIHLDDKNYSEMVDTFETDEDVNQYKIIQDPNAPQMELSVGEEDGFGKTPNNSLKLHADSTAEKDDRYIIYRPISLPKSSTHYNVSAMVKSSASSSEINNRVVMGISKISDIENMDMDAIWDGYQTEKNDIAWGNYWESMNADTYLNEIPKEDGYALWFAIEVEDDWGFDMNLDNVGFSKKDMEPEQFGKYDFYNGTSMAAPYVTGAVALVSELKGPMDPAKLRETVVNSVRESEDLDFWTKTGGVLDLAKVDIQVPTISTVRTKDDTVTINGNFFGAQPGKVMVDGNKAVIKSWGHDKIVIEQKDQTNREVTIKVVTMDGMVVTKKMYLGYNQTEIASLGKVNNFSTGVTATDGKNLYALDEEGRFYAYSSETHKWTTLESLSPTVLDSHNFIPGATTLKYDSQLVYANQALYVMASYDLEYTKAKAVVCYDLKSGKWTKKAELPTELENVDESTLASYRDKLYLVGGYDTKNQKALDTVYSLDYNKADVAFVKENATIPARFGAAAQVVGNKLVLTLGGDGTVDEDITDETYVSVPNNIVFDGQNWTEIKDSSFVPLESMYYSMDEDEMTGIPCYKAQTGLYQGGILYTDIHVKGIGDVFTYDLGTNKYTALPCSLQSYIDEGQNLYGTTVADQFLFFAGKQVSEEQYGYDLHSFAVKTGFFNVSSTTGNVEGLGYYYPGSNVVITPQVGEGQKVKSFQVDGKEVKGDSYTITNIDKDHEVNVTLECKTTGLTLDTNKLQLKTNETYQLKAEVQPAAAAGNKLTWKSNKASVVSVSDTGELTAHKPGKAVITVETTDGTKLKAKCEVEVRPGEVTGLKATSTSDSVKLSWDKVDGASGYVVYRYDAESNKDVEVFTLHFSNELSVNIKKLNGLTGSKLTSATEYTYKVAAFGMDGLKKVYGDKAAINITTQPVEK